MLKEKKQRYLGRIEIFAEKGVIQDMLLKGYPHIRIYEYLSDDKKLTVTYRQFCRLLIQYFDIKAIIKRKNRRNSKNIQPLNPLNPENKIKNSFNDDVPKVKPFGQRDKKKRWDANIN